MYFRAENVTLLPGCYRAIGYSHEETEEQQGRKLGKAQIFFVIATIIHFLVEIAIEPCWDLITVIN